VISAPSRTQLRGIELWSSLPSSTSITTRSTNNWLIVWYLVMRFCMIIHILLCINYEIFLLWIFVYAWWQQVLLDCFLAEKKILANARAFAFFCYWYENVFLVLRKGRNNKILVSCFWSKSIKLLLIFYIRRSSWVPRISLGWEWGRIFPRGKDWGWGKIRGRGAGKYLFTFSVLLIFLLKIES
jgi:hypothetical protein